MTRWHDWAASRRGDVASPVSFCFRGRRGLRDQHEQLPLTQLQIEHRAPHWPLGTPFVELEKVEHELPGVVQLAPPQHTPPVQWVLAHWSSDVQFVPSDYLI
jgi:hypothetical protein